MHFNLVSPGDLDVIRVGPYLVVILTSTKGNVPPVLPPSFLTYLLLDNTVMRTVLYIRMYSLRKYVNIRMGIKIFE